jgi:hypothetical protein
VHAFLLGVDFLGGRIGRDVNITNVQLKYLIFMPKLHKMKLWFLKDNKVYGIRRQVTLARAH